MTARTPRLQLARLRGVDRTMPRLLALPVLAATIGLAACHPTGGEEQSRKDARDVALVEAAQRTRPPAVPLLPQAVSFADLDSPSVAVALPPDVAKPNPGEGCSFAAAGAPTTAPTFVGLPKVGLLKLGGKLEMFASDSGSPMLAGGLHTSYASGEHALQLSQGEPLAAPHGWKGTLTVRDTFERIVYFSAGEMRCSS